MLCCYAVAYERKLFFKDIFVLLQAIKKCNDNGHTIDHCIVVSHLPKLSVNVKDSQSEKESPSKKKQYDYKVYEDEKNIHSP